MTNIGSVMNLPQTKESSDQQSETHEQDERTWTVSKESLSHRRTLFRNLNEDSSIITEHLILTHIAGVAHFRDNFLPFFHLERLLLCCMSVSPACHLESARSISPTHEHLGVSLPCARRDMIKNTAVLLQLDQTGSARSFVDRKGLVRSCRADAASSCNTSWQAPHWIGRKETLAAVIPFSTKEPSSAKAHNPSTVT